MPKKSSRAAKQAKPTSNQAVKGGRPFDPALLAKAIEPQRVLLGRTQAIARSLANRLIATCDFAPNRPVLGYCLKVIEEILARTHAALNPINLLPPTSHGWLDAEGLARAIDNQREQLFGAQAVTQTVAGLLRAEQDTEGSDLDVETVLGAINSTLDKILNALEPLSLGLPIPAFKGSIQ